MGKIRISHYEKSTQVLGPGTRFVIWFQGCNKKCHGCINPEGRKLTGGYEIEVSDLIDILLNTENINGITISGGEPFLQLTGLNELINGVKLRTKLDIMLFSGYKYEEIICWNEVIDIKKFFSKVDIFVDGEYVEELNENQMFRGSENQNIYCFTSKYAEFKEQILNSHNRNIEFAIDEESNSFMMGIPPKGFYKEFLKQIEKVKNDENV